MASMKTLEEASPHLCHDWAEFVAWYRRFQHVHPDQFPDRQPMSRWLSALQGWRYLLTTQEIQDGELSAMGVPDHLKPWYDLNITLRPFIVTVGEVATILDLSDMHSYAAEYIRRIRDMIGGMQGTDYDEGTMYHISMDYIKSVSDMGEWALVEDQDDEEGA